MQGSREQLLNVEIVLVNKIKGGPLLAAGERVCSLKELIF